MATEILISNNNANLRQIGEVVAMFESPHTWGGREGFPNYMHLTITDVGLDVAKKFSEKWIIDYKLDVQVNNPQRIRYKVEVAAASISASGIGRDQLKTGMQQWAESSYDATAIAFTPETFTVDVRKPFDTVQFAKDFDDIWRDVFEERKYILGAASIALGQVAGQVPDMTMAEADAAFVDKLTL